MTMDMTHVSPPSLLSFAVVAVISWVFPIGALVLRPHFVNATGERLAVKVMLYSLAWLSAPLALFNALVILTGFSDAIGILRDLLQWLW